MSAGRPPKPTALKILEGNPGKRKLNHDEPKFTVEDTELVCPEHYPQRAKAEFTRLAPEFIRLGLLNRASLEEFRNLCMAVAHKDECDRDITTRGALLIEPVMDRKGEQVGEKTVENPAVRMSQNYAALIDKLLNQFGGTPSSQAKVTCKKDAPAANTFKSKFMSGGPRIIPMKPTQKVG